MALHIFCRYLVLVMLITSVSTMRQVPINDAESNLRIVSHKEDPIRPPSPRPNKAPRQVAPGKPPQR
ncbi:Uncharacterized protein TCM_012509 [Theobroma cacao]|uniref:Uncharacterized protein n=1 Tax=Theobroma cacao TaxID=3641 RepID=A0A061G283_THECC|nr:Uncharacterized protein TCM_012509 [Theobroma cacao]